MRIIERQAVREAVARAMLNQPADTDAAIERAAHELCVPVEAVRETVEQSEGEES